MLQNFEGEIMFYIETLEHRLERGNFRVWWKANRLGYTIAVEEAGFYTKNEAEEICKQANQMGEVRERMWPVEEVLSGKAGPTYRVVKQ